ncbi:MAG: hypothetical protein KGL11_00980 [Alphaproteobacteria bacterium]|nr:hypothetical protein [Alphaproteobacteria bacterium]
MSAEVMAISLDDIELGSNFTDKGRLAALVRAAAAVTAARHSIGATPLRNWRRNRPAAGLWSG